MQRQEPRQRDQCVSWILIGLFLLVVFLVPVLGGGMMGPGMMGGYPGYAIPFSGNGWLWGLGTALGWLVMLAFWGALIAGAILLFRAIASRTEPRASSGEDPLEVLKRRYAAGEITREQYESMRDVLRPDGH